MTGFFIEKNRVPTGEKGIKLVDARRSQVFPAGIFYLKEGRTMKVISIVFGIMFYAVCITIGVLLIVSGCNRAYAATVEGYTYEQYADAIYLAEGGPKAKKPYGILSVPCDSEAACRRICINTIRNNVKRYNDYGHKTYGEYIEFLASRYAPIGADNDPQDLNRNWIKNVRAFLRKMDRG